MANLKRELAEPSTLEPPPECPSWTVQSTTTGDHDSLDTSVSLDASTCDVSATVSSDLD